MNEPSAVVVLTVSAEIDNRLHALALHLAQDDAVVAIVASGYQEHTERVMDRALLYSVPLVPAGPPEVLSSTQRIRLVRIAHNLLVLNPWRRLSDCFWIDPRWVLLKYPELAARATALSPRVVCADGREMLGAAHQVANACDAKLLYAPREERQDERLGASHFAWFHRPLLAIREYWYRLRSEIVAIDD